MPTRSVTHSTSGASATAMSVGEAIDRIVGDIRTGHCRILCHHDTLRSTACSDAASCRTLMHLRIQTSRFVDVWISAVFICNFRAPVA